MPHPLIFIPVTEGVVVCIFRVFGLLRSACIANVKVAHVSAGLVNLCITSLMQNMNTIMDHKRWKAKRSSVIESSLQGGGRGHVG